MEGFCRLIQTHIDALPRGHLPAHRPFPVPISKQQLPQAAAYQTELRKMQAALVFEAQQGYCNFKVRSRIIICCCVLGVCYCSKSLNVMALLVMCITQGLLQIRLKLIIIISSSSSSIMIILGVSSDHVILERAACTMI